MGTTKLKPVDSLFSNDIQQLVFIFSFFLAFPVLSIGVSITFYVFIIIAYRVQRQYGYVFRIAKASDVLFLLFPLVGLISLILAPTMKRAPGHFADFQILIQYVYWASLALFIKTHGSRIKWAEVMKSFFWGLNILLFCYFFIDANFSFGIVNLLFRTPRNALIFQMLCLVPFSLFYVYKRWGWLWLMVASVFYLMCTFLSEGRAGSILMLLEIFLIAIIFSNIFTRVLRVALIGGIVFAAVTFSNSTEVSSERKLIASWLSPYNGRLASLVAGEGEGDLEFDQSWLIRKLMIDKALEISSNHFWFGIGINHFTRFDASLNSLKTTSAFRPIRGELNEFYNSRSTHNTYFQVLAETGIVGLVILLLILIGPLLKFLYSFMLSTDQMQVMSVSLLAISIHFYVISSITGAIPWFIIGVAHFFTSNETRFLLSHSNNPRA